MMSLDARLARLEATHKRILRCLWCRFSLRTIPTSERPQYTDVDCLPVKCWTCGTRFLISLAGQSARQREIIKLIKESHPVKIYSDERLHTAEIWQSLSRSQVKRYRAFKQRQRREALGRERGISPAQALHREMTAEQRKAERERQTLSAQAYKFIEQQNERWKRLAKAPESFRRL